MARPTRLTRALHAQIVNHLDKAVPLTVAAEACGVPRNIVHEWVRRGEGNDERPAVEPYITFARDVRIAVAKSLIAMHSVVMLAAAGGMSDPDAGGRRRPKVGEVRLGAAQWMLARRAPEFYGSWRELSVDVSAQASGDADNKGGRATGARIEIVYAQEESGAA